MRKAWRTAVVKKKTGVHRADSLVTGTGQEKMPSEE